MKNANRKCFASKIYFALCSALAVAIVGCKDDDGVGMSVQPSEDVLRTHSNVVFAESSSILSDSVLSKYDYFLLGRYRDPKFGETTAEFMSQLDARVGGVKVPETNVVSPTSTVSGILNTLLSSIDTLYGPILSISDPTDLVVDSTLFYIQYTNNFFGDSTAIQAISVYELNKPLTENRSFTNTKVEDYCDKSLFLGKSSYQIKNKRTVTIPIENEVGERLLKVYQEGSNVHSQADFNDYFKGVYVGHTFNQGSVLQIAVAGVQIFYHFDALIKTTYKGVETTLRASEVQSPNGEKLNPLVASVFLSANKSVKRVNVVRQEDLSSLTQTFNESDYSYTFTPGGLYTSVSVPFNTLVDSIRNTGRNTEDTAVMFNSAKLILHREELNWKTNMKSSTYLMLIGRERLVDFFYNNRQPDGYGSFVAAIDTSKNTYTFNITAPLQNKLKGVGDTFDDDLVVVPLIRVNENGVVYYRQQLWLTATMFYNSNCKNDSLRPRLDVVYTRR